MNNWYYHGHNIDTKISTNYGNNRDAFIEFKKGTYDKFHRGVMCIKGNTAEDIKQKVAMLNWYYGEVETFEKKYKVTSQSKFRSTVLEQFNGYLFKDIEQIHKLGLDFFNKGIYAGIKIDSKGEMAVITKDVDFCIGKKFILKSDQATLELIIPLVAVEVKTYLDATMFNEVQFSMQIIKNATPGVYTYLLIERNEVRADKILSSKADSPLDEIFVLRKDAFADIEHKVFYEYYREISKNISVDLANDLKIPGRLFNP